VVGEGFRNTLRELPRRNAVIVVGVAAVLLVAAIVLLWDKGQSGSTAAFCTSVRTGENPLDVFDRYDPTNLDTARDQLQRGVDRLRQLEQAAPGEVSGDMKVLVEVAQQLVTALDPTAKDKSIPDFTAEFDRVRVASANVTRFAADNCAVQLESSASAAPATLPPGTPTSPP
jgi:hypothetical protein